MGESYSGEERIEMERPHIKVTRISEGLEFGDGKISAANVPYEAQQKVDEAIETNPNFLVPIDHDESGKQLDDDGCGDGRGVKRIMRGIKGGFQELKRSLNRAKVFGGALAMSVGIRIGRGEAQEDDLETVFAKTRASLDEKKVNYGGHTADHVAPGREDIDSGCGAIDLAPQIIEAAVRLEAPIQDTLKFLGNDSATADTVFDNYRKYASTLPSQPAYSGKRIMNGVMESEKVVKELEGEHRECRIVLNLVEGFTVDQALIREVSDEKAQVFAVDVWRLQQIAKAQYPEDPVVQEQALVSELVYTLATAGVLTRGDLPVYVLEREALSGVA